MIVAGIDVGSLTAECVLLDGDTRIAACRRRVQPNPVDSATAVLGEALREAGLRRRSLRRTVATGYGRERLCEVGLADEHVSEISCHGLGVFALAPSVRTVVDIGGQDAKVIRVDHHGELAQFAMNDKCAAGTGHFLELMGRTLDVELDQLGPLAMCARKATEMSSRCSIFVETEVIHDLQRGISREEVAAGVCRALAERVAALARRVHPERELAMTGGVAKNLAVRRELEKRLGMRTIDLPLDPQLIGAFGAAQLARRHASGRSSR
jgi:(R)-2-hydroxyacyl-CoA dehydratese activating ATPase